MKITAIALICLLPLICSAQQTQTQGWDKEPTEFRGVPFGTTEKQANQIIRNLDCSGYSDSIVCKSPFPIGEVRGTSYLLFDQDRLAQVALEFDSAGFDFVKSVFAEKFGAPHKSEQQAVQNRMGAQFLNESLRWEGRTVSIALDKYGSDLTKGMAIIATNEYLEKTNKEQAEKAKNAADDM